MPVERREPVKLALPYLPLRVEAVDRFGERHDLHRHGALTPIGVGWRVDDLDIAVTENAVGGCLGLIAACLFMQ
jgi:hypothetical protein